MYYYKYFIKGYEFTIVEDKRKIIKLFTGDKFRNIGREKQTYLIKKTYGELMDYFDGKLENFTVPINPQGTDFQLRVWKKLRNIPYGETLSYKDIAKKVGNENAYRAVGNANNKNPILIIIPCHRVVGIRGDLKGFASGLRLKQNLLDLEKGRKKE